MFSRRFIEIWEPRFDNQKYPEDFYLCHIDGARNSKQPEHLKKHLIALLHWKDGKAQAYVPDENRAKPHLLVPILELNNLELAEFSQSFWNLAQSDKNNFEACTESLRLKLSSMWKTVVTPAFLLHVAKPDKLPIIDQHTVRAFLALTSGKVTKRPKITWDQWEKYKVFFQDAVVDTVSKDNIEDRSRVDRALFAWGKSLKASVASKRNTKTAELLKAQSRPSLLGHQAPNTGVIPPACNVLSALQDYLELGGIDELPQFKKQNLRDLQFHQIPQSDLRELLQNPGGSVARQLLQYYRKEMGGGREIRSLPRPILDVFLVGWAIKCGHHRPAQITGHLHTSGFGGTRNATQAAVTVGRTTGRLFGLLDGDGSPTALFKEYFDI